jgi:hypothetical protein
MAALRPEGIECAAVVEARVEKALDQEAEHIRLPGAMDALMAEAIDGYIPFTSCLQREAQPTSRRSRRPPLYLSQSRQPIERLARGVSSESSGAASSTAARSLSTPGTHPALRGEQGSARVPPSMHCRKPLCLAIVARHSGINQEGMPGFHVATGMAK